MQKTRIIFVHGIGGKPPQAEYLVKWRAALGIEREGLSFSMAYWADLRGDDLSIPTKGEATTMVRDALSPQQQAALARTKSSRTRFLRWWERPWLWLRGKLLGIAEPLIRKFLDKYLDDVYNYFYRDGRRDAIMGRVTDIWEKASQAEERVILITHSLGTVVGLDCAYTRDASPVPLFVTMGSPLGSSYIQSRLKGVGFPRGVGKWLNVYDRADIVTKPDEELRDDYKPEGVIDRLVRDNYSDKGDRDPHHWAGYLSTDEVRTAVTEALAVP